ncbi:site-specific DNA-methyltransferase, partial [Bathymodiolus thermophilus thioautotrophic gill symbiont]
DGVIFISIDDNEQHHLKMLMNEVFGESNFEGHIHWRRRHNQPNDPNKLIAIVAEHIFTYSKNSEQLKKLGVGKLELTGKFSNPDNDQRGNWNSKPWKIGSNQSGSKYTIRTPSGKILDEEWMGEERTYQKLLKDKRIYFSDDGKGLPRKKIFKSEREAEGQSATNWFKHELFGSNQDASKENTGLFNGVKNIFNNPKPVKLLSNIIRLGGVNENDIILDFFAGSGTTGHAIMDLNKDGGNRQFILVQIPEAVDENSETFKAGYKN